jgi:hypothetical protein
MMIRMEENMMKNFTSAEVCFLSFGDWKVEMVQKTKVSLLDSTLVIDLHNMFNNQQHEQRPRGAKQIIRGC